MNPAKPQIAPTKFNYIIVTNSNMATVNTFLLTMEVLHTSEVNEFSLTAVAVAD